MGEPGGSGMEHRLSRRRQQFFGAAGRVDEGSRQARRQSATELRGRRLERPAALPMSDAVHGRHRHGWNSRRKKSRNLRAFFLKGGVLWVDDYWGTRRGALGRADRTGAAAGRVSDLRHSAHPSDHADALRRQRRPADLCDSVAGIHVSPLQTSERGSDSAEVHFRGIEDAHGRLMVIMSHNTDIADSWEREGENHAVLRFVLATRLRDWRQRRALRDDPLNEHGITSDAPPLARCVDGDRRVRGRVRRVRAADLGRRAGPRLRRLRLSSEVGEGTPTSMVRSSIAAGFTAAATGKPAGAAGIPTTRGPTTISRFGSWN